MNTIKVSKEHYATMGSGSLVGMVATEFPPSQVRIEFEQTSMAWRREHGPDEIIIPEYLPMCLCGDIVSLIRLGYDITTDEYSI